MPPIPAADFSGRQIPVNAGLWPPPPAACGVDKDLPPRTLAAKSSVANFVPVLAPPPDKRGFRPPSTAFSYRAGSKLREGRCPLNAASALHGRAGRFRAPDPAREEARCRVPAYASEGHRQARPEAFGSSFSQKVHAGLERDLVRGDNMV